VPFWARLLLFAAANFGACILGLAVTPGPVRVALFWPSAGLVVGALLVSDRRRWAAILVAANVPIAVFNLAAGQGLAVVATFAVGNVLASLSSAYLTVRACGGRPRLAEVGHVVAFIVAGPVLSTGVFELPPAAMLAIAHGYPFLDIWIGLWAGSGLGLLTVGTVVVAWLEPGRSSRASSPRENVERLAFAVLFALALSAVFLHEPRGGLVPREVWLFPMLVWAALRFRVRGATAIGLATVLVALSSAVSGRGAFGYLGEPMARAVAAQVFCAIAFLTELFMTSAFEMQRMAEARLRQSEKLEAIGRLAGGVAHDFNNQLTVILGSAEHLREELRGDPGLYEVADAVREGALRSARLARQLLAFSRKVPPSATSVDLHATIDDVVALLSRSIEKRIVLRHDRRAIHGVVRGDPDRLHSALLNLALNARDAMPDGGMLTFATRDTVLDAARSSTLAPFEVAPGRYVELSVRDTGVGLTEEARAHLFEPYFTTKEVGKGSGLGLPEVYGTVRAHHGAIRVESILRQGTTFTLLLPAEGDAGRAASAEAPGDARTPAPSGLRILVLDDEVNVRRSLGLLLRSAGHQVVECERGREAVDWYAAHPAAIDAAIIDVMMPDMTGREVLARLRELSSSLPVIVSSGYFPDADRGAPATDAGVYYLPKPYTTSQLQRALESAASFRSRAERDRSA
jgi:signal transduction histidine kinase/CheY-like chemotaxis protein